MNGSRPSELQPGAAFRRNFGLVSEVLRYSARAPSLIFARSLAQLAPLLIEQVFSKHDTSSIKTYLEGV
jgi:hypothetical protein